MSSLNSVHNYVYNSENGDDYIEDPDPVTLISKLDISDPLHLHPNDTTALTVVSIKLKGTENYQVWSCAMLLALEGKNKLVLLMGLLKDDSYMQIRSSILSREVLPDVRSAYATISSEESHRVAAGSITGSSHTNQASAFVSNDCSSSGFTDEQMATLISLIKDNKIGKNVQANMPVSLEDGPGTTEDIRTKDTNVPGGKRRTDTLITT
ncbi:ribonuclease H-like domain-containing protein [Tanacetum coccineum]